MASSSSWFGDSLSCNYDVFLSFRGEDTRRTIVSHLYAALDGTGINTFQDNQELQKGDHISNKLHRAIEGSKLAIVVISENYASSRWCLMELQLIMAFYGLRKLKVFPIFYEVDPSDVRHQRGSFSLGRYQGRETKDKVLEWKDALIQVAGLSGVDSRHCVNEAMMLKEIVEDISSQLSHIQPTPLDDVFGVEAYIEQMKPLMKIDSDPQARMIGIWGMGGIGKTTIAKCLYERFGRQFPAHAFIEKVDQTCKEFNLRYVQQNFLCDILRTRSLICSTIESGVKLIRSKLYTLKVFVVLDGVEKLEHLEALAKEDSWFGHGSRIIITTRDKKLLESCGVTITHEVRCLENEESLKMLKHFAFAGTAPPFDECKELAIRTSRLAEGLPFALVAFGLYLRGITSKEEWEDALSTLEAAPHPSIMGVLRTSYIDLDPRSKTIFLKIACLFNGDPLHSVLALLAETETRIRSLADKSLIHISSDGFIGMHSLIQQMAREIVLEESKYIPWQQKMLWDPLEGYGILKSNTGTRKTEGMILHICELPQKSYADGIAFDSMPNLRFLKFFKHLDDMESKLDLIPDNYLLLNSLHLLHWDAYPLTTLPQLPLDWLVELHMRYSNLESLWDGNPCLSKLRILNVTGSKNLTKLPDPLWAPKLEELIVKHCTRLEHIPESIGSLLSLKKLDTTHCDHLINLQMIIGELPDLYASLRYAQKIAVDLGDSKDTLNCLTDISIQGKLNFWLSHFRGKATHLSFSSEQRIPDDLLRRSYKPGTGSHFYGFKSINIMRFDFKSDGGPFHCYSFLKFPCLTELSLINLNIKRIPYDIELLQELQKLDLSGNDFTYLPTEMENLSKLKSLRLCNCRNLNSLPQLSQLERLKLSDCIRLQSFLSLSTAEKDGNRYRLNELWLDNCKDVSYSPEKLSHLSDMLSHCTNLTYLNLSRNDIVAIPVIIPMLPLLGTLCVNDCTKLKSLAPIPSQLTYLYARGCTSLVTIDLPMDHSIRHFDLSYCPQLDIVEELIDRFITNGHNDKRFACLPGKRIPKYFNNRTTSLPQIRHTSELRGFDACIIIACESPYHLQVSSSSYSCKQEDNGTYRINIKPNYFIPSKSTSSRNEGEPFLEHHMLIFHVPGNVDFHQFRLEPHLELPDEFQFKPARITSSKIRFLR